MRTIEMTYDDSKLYKLYEELEPKRRLQVLRGAFKREGNLVRKEAVANLRGVIHSSKDLEKGVRVVVYKKIAGFKVTVGARKATAKRKEIGMHVNRRGLHKPVLVWAEDGTEPRYTRNRYRRRTKGHFTGRMPAYHFMLKAKYATKNKVTDDLHDELRLSVGRIARRYGCST